MLAFLACRGSFFVRGVWGREAAGSCAAWYRVVPAHVLAASLFLTTCSLAFPLLKGAGRVGSCAVP